MPRRIGKAGREGNRGGTALDPRAFHASLPPSKRRTSKRPLLVSGSPHGWDPRFLGLNHFTSLRGVPPRGLLILRWHNLLAKTSARSRKSVHRPDRVTFQPDGDDLGVHAESRGDFLRKFVPQRAAATKFGTSFSAAGANSSKQSRRRVSGTSKRPANSFASCSTVYFFPP